VSEGLSKTQIDRLGERLKDADASDADLKLLDEYRRSFGEAYEAVVGTIRAKLGLEPTGRRAKSTSSVIDKLRRESIRLTQIQDIAGCRLVVPTLTEQDGVASRLREVFPEASVIDRRLAPSHGYRAVHVVARPDSKAIEIQIRTSLQHGWAQVSENYSDRFDPALKYGGGPADRQGLLLELSGAVADLENLQRRVDGARPERQVSSVEQLASLRMELGALTKRIADIVDAALAYGEGEETEHDLPH
jgi:ppGpp synthetase/RelA/SpoT-type nucleotidyltranferase